jgi:hypothetical protein
VHCTAATDGRTWQPATLPAMGTASSHDASTVLSAKHEVTGSQSTCASNPAKHRDPLGAGSSTHHYGKWRSTSCPQVVHNRLSTASSTGCNPRPQAIPGRSGPQDGRSAVDGVYEMWIDMWTRTTSFDSMPIRNICIDKQHMRGRISPVGQCAVLNCCLQGHAADHALHCNTRQLAQQFKNHTVEAMTTKSTTQAIDSCATCQGSMLPAALYHTNEPTHS